MASPTSGWQLAKEVLGLVPKPAGKPVTTTTTSTQQQQQQKKKLAPAASSPSSSSSMATSNAGTKAVNRPSPAKPTGIIKRQQQKHKQRQRQKQKQQQKAQEQLQREKQQQQQQQQQAARLGQVIRVERVVPKQYRDECIRYDWGSRFDLYQRKLVFMTRSDRQNWGGV